MTSSTNVDKLLREEFHYNSIGGNSLGPHPFSYNKHALRAKCWAVIACAALH